MQEPDLQNFSEAYRQKKLVPKGAVGIRFEREMFPRRFRELITFYRDGKILFERYCFGEAAGLVLQLWADGMDAEGRIAFHAAQQYCTGAETAPTALVRADSEGLIFDNAKDLWHLESTLKSDPSHGYRRFFRFQK